MGIFGRGNPSPATGVGEANAPSVATSTDPEKPSIEDRREDSQDGVVANNIDLEAERRVVRKLDWHVPPLVTALCMCSPLQKSSICLTDSASPPILP